MPAGQQALHQRVDVLLQQRLAAGDLDERAAVALPPRPDLVDRPLAALGRRRTGVSHQEQRRSHAVRRTNTHGSPARVDSPWIEWKISFTVSIRRAL